ncbi:MAG: manganese efflux pump MntP family protein [Desulfobacterota bacterium]|nr:manganese efflux pump MntP family protein [Thermodesulfobacteriota bacterium]
MDILTLLGIAVALALDTVAVALAAGINLPSVTFRHTFRLSWHFGLFQAMMPVIGWTGGLTVRPIIEQYDHWAAFVLLLLVGGNMIREAGAPRDDAALRIDPSRGMTLVMLSVATSIDALAVGLSFAVLNIPIALPALVIGIVSATGTAAGLYVGKRVAAAAQIGRYADIIGGCVLICIGIKILAAHGAIPLP